MDFELGSVPVRPALAFLGRHSAVVLVASIAAALAFPQVGALLIAQLRPIIVALVALAFLRTEPADVLAHVRRPGRLGLAVGGLMIAQPLVLLALLPVLDLPTDVVFGLLLIMAAPPIASAMNFAIIIGLDGALALSVTVVGLFLAPLTASIVVGLASPVGFDVAGMFAGLVINLAIAVILAALLRWGFGGQRMRRNTETLDGVTAIVMLLFILAVMSDVGRQLVADWRGIAGLLVIVIVANYGVQLVTAMAARLLNVIPAFHVSPTSGATIAMLAGNRNFGLMVAALPAATAEPLLALLALYQIPMFATPLLCGPIYRRLT